MAKRDVVTIHSLLLQKIQKSLKFCELYSFRIFILHSSRLIHQKNLASHIILKGMGLSTLTAWGPPPQFFLDNLFQSITYLT